MEPITPSQLPLWAKVVPNYVNGLDVSDFQGDVDWKRVRAAGYSFAYTKATEGAAVTHATLPYNLAAMRSNGMLAGAYHYFKFNIDPAAQVEHFLNEYKPQSGDLPPMLDLEDTVTGGVRDAVQRISKWLTEVEVACKVRPILYTGYYFWSSQLGGTDAFNGHPLWLAQYPGVIPPPGTKPTLAPSNWPTYFWQYTSNGRVDGIEGNVDLDWFLDSLDDLKKMCIP